MITYGELIGLFCPEEKEKIKRLIDISAGIKRLSLSGLAGSSLSLLAAPLITDFKRHHLFILPDRESAAFLYHDLEKLLGDHDKELVDKRVHYFPSSYRRTHKTDETDNANIKLRSEIINKLVTRDDKFVIISYPDALSEKLVSSRYLKTNSFNIKLGEGVDPYDIAEMFVRIVIEDFTECERLFAEYDLNLYEDSLKLIKQELSYIYNDIVKRQRIDDAEPYLWEDGRDEPWF